MKNKKLRAKFSRGLSSLTDRVYAAIAKSPLGRFFSAYPESDLAMKNTVASRAWRKRKKDSSGNRARRGVARAMDASPLRRFFEACLRVICRCSLRAFGALFFTMGAYYGIVHCLLCVVWRGDTPDGFALFSACALVFVGLLLLLSKDSVGYALSKGAITGWLFPNILGVPTDVLARFPREGKNAFALTVPLGMLVGALTALVGPVVLGVTALALALALIFFTTPEAGVLILMIFTPFGGFLPHQSLWLCIAVVLMLTGYICKLLRGTRVFRFEIQDLFALFLLVFALLCGVSAGEGAKGTALLIAVLIAVYFPAANMLATPQWLSRCRWVLVASSFAAAMLGILQFVLSLTRAIQSAGGVSMATLGGAVRAGFADHTSFAFFLLIAFPFALYSLVHAHGYRRVLAGLCCVSITVALALTFVQSAWVAFLAELIVACLLLARRFVPYLLTLLLASPGIVALLPAAWREGLYQVMIKNSDLSFSRVRATGELLSRVYFENGEGFFSRGRGISRLVFGVGHGGVEALSVLYTSDPAVSVLANFNFWSYQLTTGGVLGVVLPALFCFFFLQNCFSLMGREDEKGERLLSLVGVMMMVGALVFSAFRYVFFDPCALLLFFLLVCVVSADARYYRSRQMPNDERENDGTFVEMDYELKKRTPSYFLNEEGFYEL